MAIPWDLDVVIFAWSTFKVLRYGSRGSDENRRSIPIHQELQEIAEESLTPAQKDYIKKFDETLANLGYLPNVTYRVTNLYRPDRNLLRYYVNPADDSSSTLMIIEVSAKVGTTVSVRTSSSVTFVARFADGRRLVTRNTSHKSLTDNPPYRIVQEFRQITDLRELKRRHDMRLKQMGTPLGAPTGAEAVFAAHREAEKRVSEYQLARGLYRLTTDGKAYELTAKARWRGVLDHYNPLARRFSTHRVVLVASIAFLLPLFSILVAAPWVSRRLETTGAGAYAQLVGWLTIAFGYAATGLLIGEVAEQVSFHWLMLTSYAPAHVLVGWSFGWLPYTATLYVIAYSVVQNKRQRALLFRDQGKADSLRG